jgi:hypothetical protein
VYVHVHCVDMWGRMCTTGVGPAGSVDRAEDTVGVVLYFRTFVLSYLLFRIISQLSMFGTATVVILYMYYCT